ncbi:hypothetical protein [Acinetobacter sp. WCHA55]|uniref:hypothetical protein n=1 Tax=Acinetobacter sp. WCHA55 TaxID=2004646 RepID=UPI001BC887F8|nr:hypothetical protein [Acinetobacter sp. WCHA55]
MSNIYEILRPKKGYAYTDEQIVDYSLIGIPIPTNKKIKGNSRIYGDIEEANFKNIVALLHKAVLKGFFSNIISK